MLIYILLIYTFFLIITEFSILQNKFELINSLKNLKILRIKNKNLDFSKPEDLIKFFILIDVTQSGAIETKQYSEKALLFANLSLKLKENISLNLNEKNIIENEKNIFINNLKKVIVFDLICILIYILVLIFSINYILL